jgi:hypothetical protein
VFPALGPEDDDAADDECDRHRHGIEQHGLELVLEQEPQDREWQERDEEVEHEAPRSGAVVHRECGVQQLLPVFPAHREDGGALADDEQPIDGGALESHEILREDQVTGARYGEKFRDAFD